LLSKLTFPPELVDGVGGLEAAGVEDEDGVCAFARPGAILTVAEVLEVAGRERWGSVDVRAGGDREG